MTQQSSFFNRNSVSMEYDKPVPHSIEKHIVIMLFRSIVYPLTVSFVSGYHQMEATVRIVSDVSKLRTVTFHS